MSTSNISLNTTAGSPISLTGLASGLNTESIIAALMSAERAPVTRMVDEKEKLGGEQAQLQAIQASLQQLSFVAQEFAVPSLYEASQAVTSSEPTRVSAATSSGAAVGGHEIEVKQLANAAQRSFTFTSPTAEGAMTIDGVEIKVTAGESSKELARSINSNATATVYAASLENGDIILSSRATGDNSEEFIKVADTTGTLTEVAGSAKQGKDAEFTVDGVAETSASNTVTSAIPGVTLTLDALTPTGPVTIDVQPPGANPQAVESQVQAFIKLYNSTVTTIEKQLSTRPSSKASTTAELESGRLYGDPELSSLLDTMRQQMYEPIAGLPAEMSSPSSIGISTGAASDATSTASLEGQLTLNAAKLTEAVRANPTEVQTMLKEWSGKLQSVIDAAAAPGGDMEARISSDTSQVSELSSRIASMNELLAQRERALQETYAEMEAAISQNDAQTSWLGAQSESLSKS